MGPARWWFSMIVVALASTAAQAQGAGTAPAGPIKVMVNIEAQALPGALQAFGRQTGVQVLFRSEDVGLREIKTPRVSGQLPPQEALARLLAGTTLKYEFVNAHTVRISSAKPLSAAPAVPTDSREARLSQSDTDGSRSSATRTASSSSALVQLEEIVVTAQKREERLQDVPVPVTALSAEVLTSSNQLLLRDYANSVPGLSVSPSPGAGGQQQVQIRGIATGYGTNPTVGILVDDVPFGSSIGYLGNVVPDIDPSNLARVEVLRGPQGTLYGASSMGGLVKFVTLDPTTERVSGSLQAGTDTVHNGAGLGYNVRGSVNVPLTDTFAMRVNAFTREDPGYIDNPFTHVDGVNEDRASGGLVTALWKPLDTVSLKVNALYQDLKGNGAYEADVAVNGYKGPALGDLQQNYMPGIGGYERTLQLYSATLNAKLGDVSLTSVSGFNSSDYRNSFDYSYALGSLFQKLYGVGGVAAVNQGDNRKFSQEIRATIPFAERFEWLVGGFYTHERGVLTQFVYGEVPAVGVPVVDAENVPQPVLVSEYAGFTDLKVRFTDRFDVQFGARASHFEVEIPQATETGPLVGGTSFSLRGDSSSNPVTYLVTPRFQFSSNLMAYARIASGYRAGGPNLVNPSSALYDPKEPHQYDPDKTRNYEIGVKAEALDHLLSFDASLYYIDWRDIQLKLLDPNNSQSYFTNGGGAKSQGVELTIESRPLAGLTLGAWATYQDAQLTQAFPATSTAYGPVGERLPYSSRFSGNLSVKEDFPIVGDLTGSIGGVVKYAGDRVGAFTTTPVRQYYPSYTEVDLQSALGFGTWSGELYVNNLADRRGVLGGGLGTFPPYAFTYIQPRTIGLNLSKKF